MELISLPLSNKRHFFNCLHSWLRFRNAWNKNVFIRKLIRTTDHTRRPWRSTICTVTFPHLRILIIQINSEILAIKSGGTHPVRFVRRECMEKKDLKETYSAHFQGHLWQNDTKSDVTKSRNTKGQLMWLSGAVFPVVERSFWWCRLWPS